jgi:hypothetical protein
VNRLPPEVIALCATFISSTDPRPIISLTHVCRYWRKAITSSPRNWASIGSGWKRLVPLCLERAGVVPLTVDITVSDVEGDEIFLDSFPPLTSRIAHLSLTGYSSIKAVTNIIPSLFTSTMHTLTSLELQQTADPLELFPSYTLPTSQIAWELPKLRSLRLTRTPLYSALLKVTSLAELKLVGYKAPFRFGKFIEFLRSNPGLEFIILEIQFLGVMEWFVSPKVVSLDRLRQLSFTCATATDAMGLLSCMSFPRGVSLDVISTRKNHHADIRWFLPSPLTTIQQLLAPITTIKYQNTPAGSRGLDLFGNNSHFSFRCQNAPFRFDPEFHLFTTTAVREFHAMVIPCSEALFPPLSRLPALETLVLVNVAHCPSFSLDFLAEEPVLCPSLKTIAFFNCDLDASIIVELEEMVARRKYSTAAWLHRVVIVNRAGKLPDYELIHRLRRFVPRVDARMDELPDLP